MQRDLPLRANVNIIGFQVDSGDSGGVQLDNIAVAGSTPLASRGATLPYTTYEAEAGQTNGSVLAAGRTYTTLPAESSGRRAVTLDRHRPVRPVDADQAGQRDHRAGQHPGQHRPHRWPSTPTAPRCSTWRSPRSTAGCTASTRSHDGPGGVNPHRFFDDARALLPQTYPAGTVLRLAKDTSATASITVDLVDAEVAEAAQAAPAGYVNVTSHGAVANDAGDDTNAFRAAISATPQGGGVWIPAGRFVISGLLNLGGIDVRGAGHVAHRSAGREPPRRHLRQRLEHRSSATSPSTATSPPATRTARPTPTRRSKATSAPTR